MFSKRRTAVSKLDSLPEAKKIDLDKYNDVCAICFQEMAAAKVTKCRHFFHKTCLQKWLYLQDTCPLCQSAMLKLVNEASNVCKKAQERVNDIIDNDENEHQGTLEDEHNEILTVIEEISSDGESCCSSSNSEFINSDTDFFYDSMEDFGNNSCAEDNRKE